jgi:4-hydroxybenzoate polyprenyltransferase
MTGRVRLLILLARPAVGVLLGLCTATGLAQAGQGENRLLLARALVAVMGFLVFSVAVNDLADEAIDRVNLAGDRRRPLVAGTARGELVVIGATAGVVALGASATLHWAAAVVLAAGLALSAAYSLRPLRVADRGVAACLLLPAGYVAVPYLVGVLSARGSIRVGDLSLLGALYIGFIGRIVLKDFRDVRGDALFGKRTFLVRHGRRRTCGFSAACWVAGSAALAAAVREPTWALAGAWTAQLALALWLLRVLSFERGPRHDEVVISAIAIVGRGMLVTLLAHLTLVDAGWPAFAYLGVLIALAASILGQAWTMARPSVAVARLGSYASMTAMGLPWEAVGDDTVRRPYGRAGRAHRRPGCRGRRARRGGAAGRRARQRHDPAGRGAGRPRDRSRCRGAVGSLLGGGGRTGVLAVGPGRARLRPAPGR